jgi:CheY-like chemotaxis protein
MERVLQAAFGSGDVVGRWKTGFVAVLTATRLTARERLEHLCAELEHAGMPVDGAVAVLGEDAGNADELLDVALVRSRANAGRAQTQAHQRRILVVEDDTLVASVVNDLLSSRGYAVTTISDGASAAEVLCSADVVQRFQLVVLDVSLPGLDGFGLLRRMQRAGTAGELPVVLLTARATEDEIVTGLELGAVDHVAKPFSPLVLMSRLERALGS